ncbi:riboflavin synthase [Candidatus Woesearchaeota archaeon]|nr:riboflavin synthase [Candidatus Woesearchaeota archaeon]
MRIGIADTTFARINMGEEAILTLQKKAFSDYGLRIKTERYTVPGFKDLPVAAKRLFENYKCDIVLALGWVGKEDIDEVCAHEANLLLMHVEVEAKKHIIKIFFHEKEAVNDFKQQKKIAVDRIQKHVLNALALLKGKEELTPLAGQGLRQGYDHAGGLK